MEATLEIQMRNLRILFLCALMFSFPAEAELRLRIAGGRLHLRSGATREWRSFPETASGRTAVLRFQGEANKDEHCLVMRQRDVKKANWAVHLNGLKLGALVADERAMIRTFAIPPGTVRQGPNELEIRGEAAGISDDIEVRDVRIVPHPMNAWLGETALAVDVGSGGRQIPVKITVVDAEGSLFPFTSLQQNAFVARRTGVIYTRDGKARLGLPAGAYRIYASRGFEYSAPSQSVRTAAGSEQRVTLRLTKEVHLPQYVSCDPHVHTFELSRHGDASVQERVLTAAGEGLDFIVSTEHNRVDDYSPAVRRLGLEELVRAIPGNEVTTAIGHFNIFPARPGSSQPDPKSRNWPALMDAIFRTAGVAVAVQNHPRDMHSNYRPFDPAHHLSSIGGNVIGRPVRANAMEVVNSGAMSSDLLQPVRDWMGLLTRGRPIAAIGSSDTHTVDFVPIGQARTYIQSKSRESSAVFVALAKGSNLVSYGLAAEVHAAGGGVEVMVHGPSWSSVDRIEVYANGAPVWQDSFVPIRKPGVKYRRKTPVKLPRHDAVVVAVATGPGVLEPFWEVRKPYQPTSDEWTPRVIGISSALWVDGDGDGRRTSPLEIAERLLQSWSEDPQALVKQLSAFDRSVTMHALGLLRSRGELDAPLHAAFAEASRSVAEGYALFAKEAALLKH